MAAILGFFASSKPIIGQYCSSYNATEALSPSISWPITNLQPVNRNRWLYVVWTFVANNERPITDVTIAGNSAASVIERVALKDGRDFLYNILYKARVATGTSATATLNIAGLNGAGNKWSSSAWSLTAPRQTQDLQKLQIKMLLKVHLLIQCVYRILLTHLRLGLVLLIMLVQLHHLQVLHSQK